MVVLPLLLGGVSGTADNGVLVERFFVGGGEVTYVTALIDVSGSDSGSIAEATAIPFLGIGPWFGPLAYYFITQLLMYLSIARA